ncbi:hypothetical protein [Natronococcus wangiae]|uniref:hypothetical protein n=1 Tax=Natronococcus wangiae TaxID=3068275 RepID=UPI00273D66FD|nr:hypothetical protein [Natronococcus sp. AD5]
MVEGAPVVPFLLFGIALTVGLYPLTEGETSNPTVTDRATAEREAKERGGLPHHGDDGSRGDSGVTRDGTVDRSSTEWDEEPSSDEDESGFGWDDR